MNAEYTSPVATRALNNIAVVKKSDYGDQGLVVQGKDGRPDEGITLRSVVQGYYMLNAGRRKIVMPNIAAPRMHQAIVEVTSQSSDEDILPEQKISKTNAPETLPPAPVAPARTETASPSQNSQSHREPLQASFPFIAEVPIHPASKHDMKSGPVDSSPAHFVQIPVPDKDLTEVVNAAYTNHMVTMIQPALQGDEDEPLANTRITVLPSINGHEQATTDPTLLAARRPNFNEFYKDLASKKLSEYDRLFIELYAAELSLIAKSYTEKAPISIQTIPEPALVASNGQNGHNSPLREQRGTIFAGLRRKLQPVLQTAQTIFQGVR